MGHSIFLGKVKPLCVYVSGMDTKSDQSGPRPTLTKLTTQTNTGPTLTKLTFKHDQTIQIPLTKMKIA